MIGDINYKGHLQLLNNLMEALQHKVEGIIEDAEIRSTID